ncbi:DUF2938 domain-containing protein [Paraglaciecola sp. 2405UD69-4]|uniref:DUF2938 domain-containing protein n=1 Tax=Paraglaciecola sp. 2405UD69-4 TaxID=3391836 RepID=UPI0039C97672
MDNIIFVILIGIGATAFMDLWALLKKHLLHIPPTNWGMVGRWIAHMGQGKFRHLAIAESKAIRGEQLLGWTAHYVIGIGYAALLVIIFGNAWVNNPSIGPAFILGIATVVAPFLILQPGMGAGIAASRTPNPNSVRIQSMINHGVFGAGLFLSAITVKFISLI